VKRLYLIIAILALGATAWGAANVARFITRPIVASKTVSTQYTAAAWTLLDSIRLLQPGDSSASAVTVTGEAELKPGQKMYIGFGHTAATVTVADIDTFILTGNPAAPGVTKTLRLPFTYQYTRGDSVAINDTFYVCAASSDSRPLILRNITLTVQTGIPYAFNKTASKF